MIQSGKVGVCVLAGGQGSRLGLDGPKGIFDIKLPSGKSLFQILVERFLKAQLLAHKAYAVAFREDPDKPVIPPEVQLCKMLIMTSYENHDATIAHFEENAYFGAKKDNFIFF